MLHRHSSIADIICFTSVERNGGENVHASTLQTMDEWLDVTKSIATYYRISIRNSKWVPPCPLQECTEIHGSQFVFMSGRSTTDATCRDTQYIRVTFINMEKSYNRAPKEVVWGFARECNVSEPRCAICRTPKKQVQRGCGAAQMICIEPTPSCSSYLSMVSGTNHSSLDRHDKNDKTHRAQNVYLSRPT